MSWRTEAIKDYLVKNGFDGLCHDDCGCQLSDFRPCGEDDNIPYCEPGYKVEGCTCGLGCKFHIIEEKPCDGVTKLSKS